MELKRDDYELELGQAMTIRARSQMAVEQNDAVIEFLEKKIASLPVKAKEEVAHSGLG